MLDIERAIFCRDVHDLRLNIPDFNGTLHRFQRRDAGYMFFIKKCLNANQTGTGKTIEIIALNCMQRQYRQLRAHVQVVLAQSLVQWYKAYREFAPSLNVRVAWGRPTERIQTYNMPFDVLLVSFNTLWHDWEYISILDYNSIAFDEASFFKNPGTKTYDIVTMLCKKAQWSIPLTATPIQNCVMDLWSIYQTLNMPTLLGSEVYFKNRYCVEETQAITTTSKTGHRHIKRIQKITAYKNLSELKVKIAPFYLRRRVSDPEVEQAMPSLTHDVRWLELLPAQRAAYDEVKHEVLRQGYRGRELRNRFHLMKRIIDGMKTYDEHNEDVSVKADEVLRLMTGDLSEDKVVMFSWYKANIRNLSDRLKPAGVVHDFIWGDEPDKTKRFQIQERFHHDPSLQMILGTTALEMSLNLQAAKFLIFYNQLYNAARNLQVIGRIRRLGSEHGACVVISLVCRDTIEEKMMDVLQRRAAVSDFVLDENVGADVYDKLTDEELYSIIRS